MMKITAFLLLALSSVQASESSLRATDKNRALESLEDEDGWVDMLDPVVVEHIRARKLFFSFNFNWWSSWINMNFGSAYYQPILQNTLDKVLTTYDPYTISHTQVFDWSGIDILAETQNQFIANYACSLLGATNPTNYILDAVATIEIPTVAGLSGITIDSVHVTNSKFKLGTSEFKGNFAVQATFPSLSGTADAAVVGSACGLTGNVDATLSGTVSAADSVLNINVWIKGQMIGNNNVVIQESVINTLAFTTGVVTTTGFETIEAYVSVATEHNSMSELLYAIVNDDVDPLILSAVNNAMANELPVTVSVSA